MKRLILFIAFMVSVVNANGAKLVEGSLDCIKGEKYIAVSLDCSKLVYKKNRPFQDFLDKWIIGKKNPLSISLKNLTKKLLSIIFLQFLLHLRTKGSLKWSSLLSK